MAVTVLGAAALCGLFAAGGLLAGGLSRGPLVWAVVPVAALVAAIAGWWVGAARGREADEAACAREADARVCAERRRIAEDLHDGLAQDLALIALHGDRLSRDLGAEHPVAVAARRALAVTRGTIVDLAASAEPTTLDALRAVADELENRYPVAIAVSRLGAAASSGAEFGETERHQVVRIAREALLNAVRHGSASQVSVGLGAPGAGDAILRVVDDGVGIGEVRAGHEGTGFGLPSMRRRAKLLDARIVTRRRQAGGTEVSVRG